MTKISLIICTRDRAEQLRRCLDSLSGLTCAAPWELILVDNGSRDDTGQVLAAFAAAAGFPVQLVHEPIAGLARARNAGLVRAGGEIVAFTDDDCYPSGDFLDATIRAFDKPNIGYVSGRILLHDPQDFPITINLDPTPHSFAPRSYLPPGAVQGANMSFLRRALEDIGGFDVLFGSGALFPAEDIDAAAQASLAGWAGRYDPRIIVRHHHGRRAQDVPALMRAYDVGRGAYYAKLLVVGGRPDFFLRGFGAGLIKGLRHPRAFLNEIRGGFAYLSARRA